jgi:hypothetical protein
MVFQCLGYQLVQLTGFRIGLHLAIPAHILQWLNHAANAQSSSQLSSAPDFSIRSSLVMSRVPSQAADRSRLHAFRHSA